MDYVIEYNRHGSMTYLKLTEGKPATYTSSLALATRFPSEAAANSQINNSVKLGKRIYHKAVPDNEDASLPCSMPAARKEVSASCDDYETIFETEDFDLMGACSQLSTVLKDAEVYKRKLAVRFEEVEGEACDLRHRIEFPKENGKEFNAVELMALCRQYRDVLRRRRKIKDDSAKMDIIMESTLDDFKNNTVYNRLEGFAHRTYAPRVLTELFEGEN